MRSHFWPVTDVQNGNLRAVTEKGAEELANRGLPECHGSVFDRTKASECLPQSARSEFIFASLSCVENESDDRSCLSVLSVVGSLRRERGGDFFEAWVVT